MKGLLFLLALLPAAPSHAATAAKATRAASRIITPNAPLDGPKGEIIAPGGSIIVPDAPKLILPKIEILPPEPMVVPAGRALSEQESAPQSLPPRQVLKKLADSLAAPREASGPAESEAGPLNSAFDGGGARPAAEYFAAP
ncbi:MAG: hypothetical protein PHF00_04295, partial [Elusimicrobia bacterium]|nr:hypothetical protein [Elusimicrobiota bacterium]